GNPDLRPGSARAARQEPHEDRLAGAGGAVMAAKIKKADDVGVLTGKDKGRTGKVLRVLPADGRVVVSGVAMVQRHTRPSKVNPQGGIVNKEASIHVSNVALVDSKGKPTRVGFRMDGDKKVRFAKTTGDAVNG